jgi:hypothetical protein
MTMGEERLKEGRPIEPALLVRSICDRTYAPARFLPTEREDKRPEWGRGSSSALGIKRQIFTTLMSAFPSSRRVNS